MLLDVDHTYIRRHSHSNPHHRRRLIHKISANFSVQILKGDHHTKLLVSYNLLLIIHTHI